MLKPEQLADLPNALVGQIAELENYLIWDISRRIAGADMMTPTAQWQIQKAQELRLSYGDIVKRVSQQTGKTEKEVLKIFQEAGAAALQQDAAIYRAAGLDPTGYLDSLAANKLLLAGMRKTNMLMRNYTMSIARTAQNTLERSLDTAYMQVTSGAFSYDSAVRFAVNALGKQGLQSIAYPSGHTDQTDVAVRRAVVTGVNQTAARLTEDMMEDMGTDLVETTAHMGARPSHAEWQGKVYSLSGKDKKYPSLRAVTKYGTAGGLCGVNCRHTFYPFFDGIDSPANAPIDPEENKRVYQESQRQRAMERSIRQTKRELAALDGAIKGTNDLGLKEQFSSEFSGKADLLKRKQQKLSQFLEETGRKRRTGSEGTFGYTKSVSAKAVSAAKEIEKYAKVRYNTNGTIIPTNTWKSSHVSIPRTFKPNAVIDTVSGSVKQRDRNIYDSAGLLKTQIHGGSHGNAKQHPFGGHGEHVHDYVWDDNGKLINKTTRNLTDEEKIINADIIKE